MHINLSMRDIETVLVLGRTLNFRQSADQLHLSQSALSTQIRRIEDDLGVKLFDRTTRTVRLTVAGEVFLRQAVVLRNVFRDALDAIAGAASGARGRVAVAALPSLAATLLPPVLMKYHLAHPEVELKVYDTLSGAAFDLVRSGEVDFALTAADPQQADLQYDPMMSDRFVLLIPIDHRLARAKGPIRWADTIDYPHVSMTHPSSVRQYSEWAFLQNKIRFQPLFEAEHLSTIAAMVECGFGVAALPQIAAAIVGHRRIVKRLLTAPLTKRSIGLVTARSRTLSPTAAALLATLQDYLSPKGGIVSDR
ncbi:DNA-binding transcriptional LysR family regulator [Paraburkholderia sp. BL27I4N3]|uniref:LysR family transcriptional regulator n=1 Tax=Paraburkholderia sp. BL27I4N3 TaxID=1938805 RepID=UPI000E272382|nr:LysR family transcriptional regulator [Paraburkholderia sp. BL27I4N3]REE07493.1 DNA-binding transcriptional LysR family regulator [Paraburkholderia sp. BL27I4N3]